MMPLIICASLFLILLPGVAQAQTPTVTCESFQCSLACIYGMAKDEDGCDLCECHTPPATVLTKCHDLSSCTKTCLNGLMTDLKGCEICRCAPVSRPRPACPLLQCALQCDADGYARDSRGCARCACESPAPGGDQCDGVVCVNSCKTVLSIDAGNCVTCACDLAEDCGPVPMCGQELSNCPQGLDKDAAGCEWCSCAPAAFCDGAKCASCAHGYVVDRAASCLTCACQWPTVARPSVACGSRRSCPLDCKHDVELLLDSDNCPVCLCRVLADSVCPTLDCVGDRLVGVRRDQDGCDTCELLQPSDCAPFACQLSCPRGYRTDARSCSVCDCAEEQAEQCKYMDCGPGTACHAKQVMCFDEPCPKAVRCIIVTVKGCPAPSACDLTCQLGLALDPAGCPTCACLNTVDLCSRCPEYTECKLSSELRCVEAKCTRALIAVCEGFRTEVITETSITTTRKAVLIIVTHTSTTVIKHILKFKIRLLWYLSGFLGIPEGEIYDLQVDINDSRTLQVVFEIDNDTPTTPLQTETTIPIVFRNETYNIQYMMEISSDFDDLPPSLSPPLSPGSPRRPVSHGTSMTSSSSKSSTSWFFMLCCVVFIIVIVVVVIVVVMVCCQGPRGKVRGLSSVQDPCQPCHHPC